MPDIREPPSPQDSILAGIKSNHLVGGLCGGVIATLITHPFDLIKLRLAGKGSCTKLKYSQLKGMPFL